MPVPMELSRIIISEINNQIIYLKEIDGDRTFPILIGLFEATMIDRQVKGLTSPRPLTHDLVCAILRGLDASIQHIVVCDLRNQTFFAKLVLMSNGRSIEIDSRPSDAIALAVQTGAPMYVEEKVFDEVVPGQQPDLPPLDDLETPED